MSSSGNSVKLTPMMTQYRRIKSELPKDALLMFRLGDFYEMFFEDALEASQILNIALTKRGTYPMCGIPYHAAEGYLSKLLEAGRKVFHRFSDCASVSCEYPFCFLQRLMFSLSMISNLLVSVMPEILFDATRKKIYLINFIGICSLLL